MQYVLLQGTYDSSAALERTKYSIQAINDAMAIGSIKILQKYGFNQDGNSENSIPIVGVDGLPKAKELINQGIITGTIIQDSHENAEAIYTIGLNMISGTNPLSGTNYKFDETGITIKLPSSVYTKA